MLFWQENGFLVDCHDWQFHLVSTLGSSQMSPPPCFTHLVRNFVLCKILICLRYCIITNVVNMLSSLFIFPAICKEQVFVCLFVCFAFALWAGQYGTDTILAYFMMTVATLGAQWWCSKMTLSWFLWGHHEIYLPFKSHVALIFWCSSVATFDEQSQSFLTDSRDRILREKFRGVLFSCAITILLLKWEGRCGWEKVWAEAG